MQNNSLVITQHGNVRFASAVRGCHVYQDIWKTLIREKHVAKREFDNPMDKRAMKVVLGNKTVGHLPREFSRIAWYFRARSGEISVVIGCRRHCKQLCGGIPCQLKFTCLNILQMKRLKELLANNIRV